MSPDSSRLNRIRVPSSSDAVIECGNFVGGKWVILGGPKGPVTEIRSPYTGAVIGKLHASGPKDVDDAVAAAARAAAEWRRVPVKERCQVLLKFREILLRDLDLLAQSAALECGKTVAEADPEVSEAVDFARYYADQAELHVLPPLCPLGISPADFAHGGELIERARRATGRWLDDGNDRLPDVERFLSLHQHSPHLSSAVR